jgi:ppGpp synthetase/RelA/SpoT-type nucleotidyltranferase
VFHHPERDAEFRYETYHEIFIIPEHEKPDGSARYYDMPTTFELQIRTLFMHAYSEPQHEFGYKDAASLPSFARRRLAWIAASAWGADAEFEELNGTLGNSSA